MMWHIMNTLIIVATHVMYLLKENNPQQKYLYLF